MTMDRPTIESASAAISTALYKVEQCYFHRRHHDEEVENEDEEFNYRIVISKLEEGSWYFASHIAKTRR